MNLVRKLDIRRLANVLEEKLQRENESITRLYASLLSRESDIVPGVRDRVVRWLQLINQQFDYHPETFALCVNILDRLLTTVKAKSKYLRCIAISSYFLAIKLLEEDENIPPLQEVVKVSECGCSVSDVLRMERVILTKLQWDLHNPTAFAFLQLFHTLIFYYNGNLMNNMIPPQHFKVMTAKLENCLCMHKFTQFKGSVLSLALLSEELESLSPSWLAVIINVQNVAKTDYGELIRCREVVAQTFASKTASSFHGKITLRLPSLATIPECAEDPEVSLPKHLHVALTSPAAAMTSPAAEMNNSTADSHCITEELKRLHSMAIGLFDDRDSPIKTKRLKMVKHRQGSCGQQLRQQSCGVCTVACRAVDAIAL